MCIEVCNLMDALMNFCIFGVYRVMKLCIIGGHMN